MTTGRINQVAIINDRTAPNNPKAEAEGSAPITPERAGARVISITIRYGIASERRLKHRNANNHTNASFLVFRL